ncbi:MAG: bacillithiol biosynthesis deacetylase BshB1 [Balneolaceae bacterium]|nr:bacillithiol biosynthesis deacetylase BshB1 [Balneolaceae bacterium]
MKLDILVFASHPDDAELSIGGTIAALCANGKKAGIVDLTQGEMGSRGTPTLRMKEAEKATKILGVSYRNNLQIPDTLIKNNRENQLKIIREVRKTQPHICLVGAPRDRHPDHGYGTDLVLDALFYAGLKKIEPGDSPQHTPWRPKHILHYMQDRPMEPDFIFDVSGFMDKKKQSILAYSSQFNVENPGDEPATYISSTNYFKQMEARCRYFGHLGGFEFGEPFKYYDKPVPLNSMNLFFESNPKR